MKKIDVLLFRLVYFLRWCVGRAVTFKGRYGSWQEALGSSSGYDDATISERAFSAAIFGRERKNRVERDGVLVETGPPPFALVSALLMCGLRNNGVVRVLDFGGGYGSHYFQLHHILQNFICVEWSVVEQPQIVQKGNAHFSDGNLEFFCSIKDAFCGCSPNFVLLSGVLQYIENYDQIISDIFEHSPDVIFLDRTPFVFGEGDIISVQHVPPSLIKSSYPVRIFSKKFFFDKFLREYDLFAEFDAIDRVMYGPGSWINFLGAIFVNKRVLSK